MTLDFGDLIGDMKVVRGTLREVKPTLEKGVLEGPLMML